jgi:hypothetical protein
MVVNCAASSNEDEATFFVAENVESMSTLDLTPDRLEWIRRVGGAVKEITVRTATLDSLLEEAGFPRFISSRSTSTDINWRCSRASRSRRTSRGS